MMRQPYTAKENSVSDLQRGQWDTDKILLQKNFEITKCICDNTTKLPEEITNTC